MVQLAGCWAHDVWHRQISSSPTPIQHPFHKQASSFCPERHSRLVEADYTYTHIHKLTHINSLKILNSPVKPPHVKCQTPPTNDTEILAKNPNEFRTEIFLQDSHQVHIVLNQLLLGLESETWATNNKLLFIRCYEVNLTLERNELIMFYHKYFV